MITLVLERHESKTMPDEIIMSLQYYLHTYGYTLCIYQLIIWHGSKTRPSRRRVDRVVSVSARSETSLSHESVDSTQRRPTRPRIGVDSVDSALWRWFCASSQFNVEITTLACIYECSLCNLIYCACILTCFYRWLVYLYFRFMLSVLGDMF